MLHTQNCQDCRPYGSEGKMTPTAWVCVCVFGEQNINSIIKERGGRFYYTVTLSSTLSSRFGHSEISGKQNYTFQHDQ